MTKVNILIFQNFISKFNHTYDIYTNRMEGQLGDFECKRIIKHRWKKTDKEYLDAQHSSRVATQQSLCSSLCAAIVRRQFLLKLKVKYAGIVEFKWNMDIFIILVYHCLL